MSLVEYSSDSSSESESERSKENPTPLPESKRLCRRQPDSPSAEARLPIPKSLLSSFSGASSAVGKDDPSRHAGRQRSFPHVKGNWATFVFIPCPEHLLSCIRPVLAKLFDCLKELRGPQLDVRDCLADGLHLSLSRVVSIPHHLIKPLTEELHQQLSIFPRFNCVLEKPSIYCNDEKSRSFISLDVAQGKDKIKQLMGAVDKVFTEFGLAKFYKEALFHVSVGWMLGEVRSLSAEEEQALLSVIRKTAAVALTMSVDKIVCRTGNKARNIQLRQ